VAAIRPVAAIPVPPLSTATGWRIMTVREGINGLGRIGRLVDLVQMVL
jgi:hypothetical protein